MGLFNFLNSGNKENKEKYDCKKFFPISKPWGYNPSDVDEAIAKYNSLLVKQKNIILKMKNENSSLKNEMHYMENELKNLQIQLSFTTIPEVSEIQEKYILDEFQKNIGSNQKTQEENKKPKKKIITEENDVFDVEKFQKVDEAFESDEDVENLLSKIVSDTFDADGDDVIDIPIIPEDNKKDKDQEEKIDSDFFENFKF